MENLELWKKAFDIFLNKGDVYSYDYKAAVKEIEELGITIQSQSESPIQPQQSVGWSDRDMLKAFWAGYYEHVDYSSKGTTNSDFEYWLAEYKSKNKVK